MQCMLCHYSSGTKFLLTSRASLVSLAFLSLFKGSPFLSLFEESPHSFLKYHSLPPCFLTKSFQIYLEDAITEIR